MRKKFWRVTVPEAILALAVSLITGCVVATLIIDIIVPLAAASFGGLITRGTPC